METREPRQGFDEQACLRKYASYEAACVNFLASGRSSICLTPHFQNCHPRFVQAMESKCAAIHEQTKAALCLMTAIRSWIPSLRDLPAALQGIHQMKEGGKSTLSSFQKLARSLPQATSTRNCMEGVLAEAICKTSTKPRENAKKLLKIAW